MSINRIIIIFLSFTLLSCKQKKIADQDFYQALNQLIESEKNPRAILIAEPLKFHKLPIGLFDWKKGNKLAIPPPETVQSYSVHYYGILVSWLYKGLLDSLEAEYMYKNQDTDLNFILDRGQVEMRTISSTEMRGILKNEVKSNFTIYRVSYPLYNQARTKLILTIEYRCGGECGEGKIYFLEKISGEWIIKDQITDWVS